MKKMFFLLICAVALSLISCEEGGNPAPKPEPEPENPTIVSYHLLTNIKSTPIIQHFLVPKVAVINVDKSTSLSQLTWDTMAVTIPEFISDKTLPDQVGSYYFGHRFVCDWQPYYKALGSDDARKDALVSFLQNPDSIALVNGAVNGLYLFCETGYGIQWSNAAFNPEELEASTNSCLDLRGRDVSLFTLQAATGIAGELIKLTNGTQKVIYSFTVSEKSISCVTVKEPE